MLWNASFHDARYLCLTILTKSCQWHVFKVKGRGCLLSNTCCATFCLTRLSLERRRPFLVDDFLGGQQQLKQQKQQQQQRFWFLGLSGLCSRDLVWRRHHLAISGACAGLRDMDDGYGTSAGHFLEGKRRNFCCGKTESAGVGLVDLGSLGSLMFALLVLCAIYFMYYGKGGPGLVLTFREDIWDFAIRRSWKKRDEVQLGTGRWWRCYNLCYHPFKVP